MKIINKNECSSSLLGLQFKIKNVSFYPLGAYPWTPRGPYVLSIFTICVY